MPFIKLDQGVLSSTLWDDSAELAKVFLTACLMAEPFKLEREQQQLDVRTMSPLRWSVPPGLYGFVRAAGVGIVNAAHVSRPVGLRCLIKLGTPDSGSKSSEFGGRRLVRINGGFLVLNYFRYRQYDFGAADRMKALRASRSANVTDVRRTVTEAEAEAEAEAETSTDYPPTPQGGVVSEKHAAAALALFEYWTAKTGHQKAKFTPERRRKILARLREGMTEEEGRQAIDGCWSSEFHRGANETGTVYDSINLIFRSREKVDEFIARSRNVRPVPL